jgi:hypothetical protein
VTFNPLVGGSNPPRPTNLPVGYAAAVVRLITALLLWGLAASASAETLAAPCDGVRISFPTVDAEPTIRIFKDSDVAGWKPPACTRWPAEKFHFIGTATASFRHSGDASELARRYGAISEYAAMRYFSPSRQTWRELSFEAFALRDANPASKRGDFTAAEFVPGIPRYFWQRGATEAPRPFPGSIDLVNRIEVLERTADRLVVAVTSEPGTVAAVMRLGRGDIRVVYFLERDENARDAWHYFALTSLAGIAALGADNFYRASARGVFRHTAGLPPEVRSQE